MGSISRSKKYQGKSGQKTRNQLPPYREIFDDNVIIIRGSSNKEEPFWDHMFHLKIVEAIPGTWLSKITKHLYGKPLLAYDRSTIDLLSKAHNKWLMEHVVVGSGNTPNLPNFYKSGNVPEGYDEWNFHPDKIFVGQRFFLLRPHPFERIELDPMVIKAKAPSSFMEKTWAGIGEAHSGDMVIVGAHNMNCRLYNVGQIDDWPRVQYIDVVIHGYKFGLGLGGSWAPVFTFMHGVEGPKNVSEITGGWDFDIALGGQLGAFLKGLKGVGRALKTVEEYKKLRTVAKKIYELRNSYKSKQVHSIPIPIPFSGVHLWGGFKFGDVEIVGTGEGI